MRYKLPFKTKFHYNFKFNKQWLHYILYHLIWGALFVAGSFLSFQTRIAPVSSFWFPSSLLCSAILLKPKAPVSFKVSFTILYIVTVMGSLLYVQRLPGRIIGSLTANVAQPIITIFILQAIITKSFNLDGWVEIDFSTIKQGVAFVIGSVIGAAVSATIGSTAWLLTGLTQTYGEPFLVWFSSVGTVHFLLVPLILSIKYQFINRWPIIKKTWKNHRVRILGCLFLIILAPIPVWLSSTLISGPLRLVVGLYIDVPIVLLSVSFGGVLAATLASFAAGACSIILLVYGKFSPYGYAPFSVAESVATIALFVIMLSMFSILFSGVLQERDKALYYVEQQVQERTAQLENTLDALKESKAIAEHLSHEKSEFMAFLCHELRNPLHAVMNIIENDLETLVEYENQSQAAVITPNNLETSFKSVLSFSNYMMALLNDGYQ